MPLDTEMLLMVPAFDDDDEPENGIHTSSDLGKSRSQGYACMCDKYIRAGLARAT